MVATDTPNSEDPCKRTVLTAPGLQVNAKLRTSSNADQETPAQVLLVLRVAAMQARIPAARPQMCHVLGRHRCTLAVAQAQKGASKAQKRQAMMPQRACSAKRSVKAAPKHQLACSSDASKTQRPAPKTVLATGTRQFQLPALPACRQRRKPGHPAHIPGTHQHTKHRTIDIVEAPPLYPRSLTRNRQTAQARPGRRDRRRHPRSQVTGPAAQRGAARHQLACSSGAGGAGAPARKAQQHRNTHKPLPCPPAPTPRHLF
ncbi:hypothetical protein COO60DRAFT_692086 [Scenedesmus sp. NREL 46B-D3]|nr:hypothetical protein COO60DRAFT_692086 [Scenedesmus sp. NREL 46B-D3]